MPNAPWFKFFAADYMSSPFVQALDPEQELWYVRLIIASAISLPRGCLPLANGKLWRLAKAPSEKYFEESAGPILDKFEKDAAAGVYRVPKVACQQLHTPSELSTKRSEAGKRGAANRWQVATRNDGKLPSEAITNEKQNIADSDSDSDSDIKLEKPFDTYVSVDDGDPSDPRHAPIRALIQQKHLAKFSVRCQWDGSEAKALDRLLSANPSWTENQISKMVINRFDSEGVTGRPRSWLPRLDDYTAGPLDRYNKLKGGTQDGTRRENRAERRQAANLAARESARTAVLAN